MTEDGAADVADVPSNRQEEEEEQKRTARVRDQGQPDGLFRACMDAIEIDHSVGQALRTAMLAAGLLTDARCYAELLVQFYVATAALERALEASTGPMATRVKQLGFNFTPGYEADLAHLLGPTWRKEAAAMASPAAAAYVAAIEAGGEATLVAAVFTLWGPLAIGGGAALKPRVAKAFGLEATNVFEDVVGPGRGKRRKEFITAFDDLCASPRDAQSEEVFAAVVSEAGGLMARNNAVMRACRLWPFWAKWAAAGTAVLGLAAAHLAASVLPLWARARR